ncbi:MAG: peptidylprolyl isomerase [Bacteroidetes bacterium]|nr:peptidylprolyl isomerase [Bacteroidota bacterium]
MKPHSIKLVVLLALYLVIIPLTQSSGLAQPSIVSAQPEAVITDIVTMETSKGTIIIGLYGLDAPKTVENFTTLASKSFYNGILFHRIVSGFVIQAGDPATRDTSLRAKWGRGGESIYGGKFADELNDETPSYKTGYVRGVIAMANSGENTNLSQFFFCLDDLSDLPKKYTMFGRVLKGMEVVDAIAESDEKNSVPIEPIRIISTSVQKPEMK